MAAAAKFTFNEDFTGGDKPTITIVEHERRSADVEAIAHRKGFEAGQMQARATALVVDDALPAGFEIETTLGADDAQSGPFKFLGELSAPDVQEARDDRYVAAMDLAGGKTFAFAYVARAVTPGSFFLPAPEARDMYRPTVNARGVSGRVAIAAGP